MSVFKIDFYVVSPERELLDLIPEFISNRRLDVANFRRAIQQNDSDRIRFINHTMRGVCLSYGFIELDRLSRKMTDRYTDFTFIEKVVDEIDKYLDSVVIR